MTRSKRTVINVKKVWTDRLPEWANEGAVLVAWMHAHGVLDGVSERLRIQREGGYVGLDLVLFLLFFISSRLAGGIKGFGERAAGHSKQLGALGGRRRLPTPASVSRILRAVESPHTEGLSEWLLFEACGANALLSHPSVGARDALGRAWHVFDLDPTVSVLRQRALPDLEDLPPARRRAEEFKLGYSGRKRGDVQVSRMTLQHAGSSLWLGLWMAPGNGEWRAHSEAAVRRVRSICDRINHPGDHALVRVDGAGGNVPLITACEDAGVRYLARWPQYEILDDAEVRRHLNATSWIAVADSGSGPRRQAAEIGWITLSPAESTLRDDGSTFAPVRARVVVSRFQAGLPQKKRGSGALIDGWQYELYVTNLPSDAWPTGDIVTNYYGRCGQENRFYQEDQDLGLDHIFSYNVAGQQLANLVGLFLWNYRVCGGLELADVPKEIPVQSPRIAENVAVGVLLEVGEKEEEEEEFGAGAVGLTEESDELQDVAIEPTRVPAEDVATPDDVEAGVDIGASIPPTDASPPWSGTRIEARKALSLALNGLNWPDLLEARPNWRWDPQEGLICPNGQPQHLQSIKIPGRDRTRQLRFLAPHLACAECKLRAGCTLSKERLFRKETALTVPTAKAYPVHQLHDFLHGRGPPPLPAQIVAPPPRPPRARKATPRPTQAPPSPPPTPTPLAPAWDPRTLAPGPLAVTPAVLLPAKLRKFLAVAHRGLDAHVEVKNEDRPTLVNVFALTSAERQNRRLSWVERLRWNALPDASEVNIVFAGSDDVQCLLQRSLGGPSASIAA